MNIRNLILGAAIVLSMASAKAQVTVVASGNCGAQGANLTWVLTNDSVLTISGSGDMANNSPWFSYQNAIKTLIIGDSVTSIGVGFAFEDCRSLISVTIGNIVKSIGWGTFFNCSSLSSVIIGNSVTSIGWNAFQNCYSLSSVTIGSSVDSIGRYAFYNCRSLSSITCYAVTPPIHEPDAFYNVNKVIPVYIPCLTYDDYRVAWSLFHNFIIIGGDITLYNASTCYGVPYTDQNFTTPIYYAGTYSKRLINANSCDSVVWLMLTEYPPVSITTYSDTTCQEIPYFFGSKELTTAGIYYDTLQNVNGCDSVVELTLYIMPNNTTTIDATIDEDDTYQENGFSESITGIYTQNLQNIFGCDSIVILNLTVLLGIVETYCNTSLRVYPNPTTNQLKIANYELRDANYSIFSVVGQVVMEGQLGHEGQIDVSNLSAGMYFLKVDGKVVKFVKE